MDARFAKMLTKDLCTKKRKGKVQNDSSKRVKVGVSSSKVPTSTAAVFEVIVGIETALTVKVGTVGMGSVPSMPLGSSDGDQVLELPVKKGIGEGRKKKVIAKTSCKACLDGPDGDDNERGKDPFDNPEVIQNLADRFAMPESDHQMLAHSKRAHHQEAEAQKAQKDLRAKIHHLQERVDESPTNADSLPLGVPIKPLIKNLRKKVHLLKKKLKKMEDDLRASQKIASEATKELTHL
ncbi:hypothetical protein COCNU_06G018330 [Cocos nucifera]|uniref:Uncharacterized protein n=1 Tax=Cocos nucifera TaxID=13894 RepID=A0A8K0ICT5_COCNU|nr:hypothetical protein COCNU_06G018330 [Cocos nucifera]